MDTIKSIIQWFISNVFYTKTTLGFIAVIIIGFFAFFLLQMLCIKAKSFFIKAAPIYLIVFLLMVAVLSAITDGINPQTWFGPSFYFLIMIVHWCPKILFFALGDALAWIIHKKKKAKQQEENTQTVKAEN